jgi:hypothetical protein
MDNFDECWRFMMDEGTMNKGAILSKSVAAEHKPILFAERSHALDETDSGWQFLGAEDEDMAPEEAQVWAVSEVIEHEPTLSKYIDMPAGTRLTRASSSTAWRVVIE